MRGKLVAGVIIFFVVIGVVIGLVEVGPSVLAGGGSANSSGPVSQSTAQSTTTNANNPIAQENTQAGSIGWLIQPSRQAYNQIQAYAGATSVAPGKSIAFYVSTQKDGTMYRMDVYRLGWYGGAGARIMTYKDSLPGMAQGYYDQSSRTLVNCPRCTHYATQRVEANWKPSVTLPIPADWTTGVYLAKFTDANGMQTYATFDVLGNPNSAYVAVTPDTTYAAYNTWGGYSLYDQEGNKASETANAPGTIKRGVEVSFDRPYLDGAGASQVLIFEIQTIRWMEQHGYDVSYISSVDLNNDPGQLLHHKAYISLGHDEYWTKTMRDGVESARNHGVGLIFMGADPAYWQMRFAPDTSGVPNRTIVCYKVQTVHNDLPLDPEFGKDNTIVTSLFRDPVINRPENALVGVMFSDLTHKQLGFPWQVDPSAANSPLLQNTNLQPGQQYGCGTIGYEWDKIFPANSPKGLHILGTTHTVNDTGNADTGNTTYYYASSGAMVFASGSIYWGTALDTFRYITDKTCGSKNTAVPEIQALMANVMDAVIAKHPAGS